MGAEMPPAVKRLLTADECGAYVSMSAKRLYNRVSDGSLPAALRPIRVGKRAWRWDRIRIDEWLEGERRKVEGRQDLTGG